MSEIHEINLRIVFNYKFNISNDHATDSAGSKVSMNAENTVNLIKAMSTFEKS